MADKANVITICGSMRKGSFNAALARALPKLAPEGLSISAAPPWTAFPLYDADMQNSTGFPAAVETLAAAVRQADGVIFVTPEYNWSIPGGLKNAIDWLSRMKEQPFLHKPVAIQSCTGGPLGGARVQYHLRMACTFLDAPLFGRPEVFVGSAAQKFDDKTLELKDQPTIDMVKQQLAGFEKFVRKMTGKS